MKSEKLLAWWSQYKALLLFIVLMSVFRSSIADWNDVPTGSMKPTIIEGDRIVINKLAYDLRVPFTHYSLLRMADPERGDIVIFDSQAVNKRLVKRVVGLPGDEISMWNNILYINGQRLDYTNLNANVEHIEREEDLLGVNHRIQVKPAVGGLSGSLMANMAPVTVPPDHYFVLGDNRDNSSDSRVIGFIPREEIIGRSRTVALSLNYERAYLPRGDRFLHRL